MALLQVGSLAAYLSGPLISGFMCASAFHVVASQLNYLFGIKLPRVYGPGNLLLKFYNLCVRITQTNVATVVICIICICMLHVFRMYINPFFRKKFKFPIPVELILVVLGTVISHFVGFSSRWGVTVVGKIPSGLPAPVVPTFAYFSDLVPDIFVIAIIVFAINAGLAKTYASEFGYDILDNQELLALGISNTFASFFQCHTACGALGRTAVVVTIGMASQIASLISCGIFLIILFFIAPYLESLPRAILGCIVCVALTSTFKKALDLKRLWKVSKIDASIWLVSFLTTFAVDIIYGVGVGFIYSILTVVSRSQYGGRFLLGEAKNTDLYSELKRFEEVRELESIKIIRYDGPVYFANVASFQKAVYRLSGVDPVKVQRDLHKKESGRKFFSLHKSKSTTPAASLSKLPTEGVDERDDVEDMAIRSNAPVSFDAEVDAEAREEAEKPLRYIILDASGWMFTDTVGLRGIKEMIKNYTEVEVNILVAALRPRLREMFDKAGVFSVLSEENFSSVCTTRCWSLLPSFIRLPRWWVVGRMERGYGGTPTSSHN
ncbi:Solute carrier family 26 member 9 [Taenia crassiceps]|uniref:Solute carrier family 26 member 9 n=1 Tax=Taenia crassiceps TaxID=6207 RepID=A0ABR4QMS7_9CEST